MRLRTRFLTFLFVFILIGCNDGYTDIEVLPPTTVKVPYSSDVLRNQIQISIDPIEGWRNAVNVKIYIHGCRQSSTTEWRQEGPGEQFMVLDRGMDKVFVKFLELYPGQQNVNEVKLSILHKTKDGPR